MPFHYELRDIPDGVAGTYATVREIANLIRQGTINERVRLAAVHAIGGCPNKDKQCEANAVYNWVKSNIKFVNDPWGAELLHHADAILMNRVGDCLPESTLLLTDRLDYVRIGEVSEGQRIIGRSLNSVIVTSKMHKGIKKCLRFVLCNGCTLTCTPNHKLFLQDGREILASEVRVGDSLLKPVLGKNDWLDVDKQTDDPDFYKFLGLYAADGWADLTKKSVGIAGKDGFPKEKNKHWVREFAEGRGYKTTWNSRYISVRGDDIIGKCIDLCGKLAINKHLPPLYGLSKKELMALHDGMSADSGLSSRGTTRVFSTISERMALDLRILMNLLGYSCSIKKVTDHYGFGSNPIYRITENKHRPRKIKVLSIEDAGEHNTYDIETSSGDFYLPESDVVVHNCDDHVIVSGSMLRAIGIPVRIVIIGAEPSNPQAFSHIYLQANVRGVGWVGFDTSVPGTYFGWEPPQFTRKQVIEIDG